ncbi:helix-turn-helix domain-containing protein [Actinomadura barringtoniae]|uniref:Helix-turn-helix domain-containing protein n=1 Tax=Actinomadura barringtoniae TaxID=1427535 RepID=A0A939T4I0_9ACTN|nr:helix-turn-helix domain-containing protein [Actinomadura barringtoniae]MBO2448239.1 helix-turn-helix domain-containing protein [Actinomadura barringtoniae]
MDASAYGPLNVPVAAWQRPNVRDALVKRDISEILRVVQQHTGVSQARLGAATGLGQGRVNEIINRRREVARLDVYERIADGLRMPDDARALLGLAPRRAFEAATLAGHAEIAQVFPSQPDAAQDMRDQVTNAASVDILAVRVLGLLALNDSVLRKAVTERRT